MKKKTFSGRFVRVLGDELGWSCGEEILAKRRDILLSSLTISRKSCAWWSGLGWFGLMDDALLLFDADSVLMCMYVCRWLIRHGAWETGYGEMAIAGYHYHRCVGFFSGQ